MNQTEFEVLRDLPGKKIVGDIRFSARKATKPLLVAEDIRVENSLGMDVRLTITYNPEVDSTTINAHVRGVGPICRLDIDGPPHRPAGRSHKHSLKTERCSDRNLADNVEDRPDLSGKKPKALFAAFCKMASITHKGTFYPPEENSGSTS